MEIGGTPPHRHTIVGLGELLWDLFVADDVEQRRLGGAPANVAYHATMLGDRGVVASRVGSDLLGEEALQLLGARGVDISLVQQDPQLPTGTARVVLAGGEPRFAIDTEAAWSALTWTAAWETAIQQADLLCFGTLCCGRPGGRVVLERAASALPRRSLRLLDLNLRRPFDQPAAIEAAVACANAIKLNEDELRVLARLYRVQPADLAEHLLAAHTMQVVAVTRGARGSLLWTAAGCHEHAGVGLEQQGGDPVGAGDAFTAALAHHLLRDSPPERANAAANRYAAFVASRPGAMPEIPGALRRVVTESDPPDDQQERT